MSDGVSTDLLLYTSEPTEPTILGTQITKLVGPNAALIAICILGFFGNTLTLIVIWNDQKLRKRQGVLLIINQCVVDWVASVLSAAFYGTQLQYGEMVMPYGGVAGELMCRIYTVMPHWGTMVSSTFNLLAITTEQYLAVVYPVYHNNVVTMRKLHVVMALIWILGPLYVGLFSIPTQTLGEALECIMPLDWLKLYGFIIPLLTFFLPAVIMVYMYARAIQALRVQVHPGEAQPQTSKEAKLLRAQHNLMKTLVAVTICFICCWAPNQIYYLLRNTTGKRNQYVNRVTTLLAYLNLCVNPFIYVLNYKEFRQGARHLFRCQST